MRGSNHPVVDLASALDRDALAVWLDDQFARHAARRDELLAAFKRFQALTVVGIADDATMARAVDFSNQLREAVAACEETRTSIKAPVLSASRQIDDAGRAINEPIVAARTAVNSATTKYMLEVDRRQREAARLEAERLEAEAASLLDQAVQTNDETLIERANEADVERERAEAILAAKPAELTRVRTALGSVAALRDNWQMTKILDITKVPAHLLMVNEQAVRLAIKQGAREIPGLLIENKQTVR